MQANPILHNLPESGKLSPYSLTESHIDKFLDAAAHKGGALTGLAVMIASLIISFDTLMNTAQIYGFGWFLSILWPLLIDGIILSQSLVVLRRERLGFSTRFNWLLLLTFEAASLLINGAAGWQLGIAPLEMFIGALIHGLPPLALFLISKSMANDIKDNSRLSNATRTLGEIESAATKAQRTAEALAQQAETKATALDALAEKESQLKVSVAALKREHRAATNDAPATTSEDTKNQARDILAAAWRNGEEITGAELGRRIERSGTLGRKLKAELWPEISQGETNSAMNGKVTQ